MESYKKVMSYTINEPSIMIIPLADLHIGADNCNIAEIKKAIKLIQETPNCYCTLGGDIVDNGVLVGKNLGVFASSMSPMKAISKAVELLTPIKSRILCAVSGNHELRSEKVADINPMYMIMSELGLQDKYRRSLAIFKVQLGAKCNNQGIGKRQTYTFLVHHGCSSAESAIKKDFEFINSFEGADIIITSHTHKGRVAKGKKNVINKQSDIVSERETTVVITNSFLDDAEYAMEKMLSGTVKTLVSLEIFSGKKKTTKTHL